MVEVAKCESNFTHYRPDGTVLRGRVTPADSGVMQINKRYHPDADADSLWGNLAYARELFDAEGSAPWVCSHIVAKN